MSRSEYSANQALAQAVRTPSGWVTPSRCVRRKESAFKRVLRLFGL